VQREIYLWLALPSGGCTAWRRTEGRLEVPLPRAKRSRRTGGSATVPLRSVTSDLSEESPTWEAMLAAPAGGADLSALLDELALHVAALSGAAGAALGLMDRAGRTLHWLGVAGSFASQLKFAVVPLSPEVGRALSRGGFRRIPSGLQAHLGDALGLAPAVVARCFVAPVGTQRRLSGLVLVGPRRSAAPLSAQERRQLETVLLVLPIAMGNVWAVESLSRRVKAHEGLRQTASVLRQAIDPSTIYRALAEQLALLVPYASLSFLAANRSAGTLPTVYAAGRFARELYAASALGLEAGIAGVVARTGQPEIIADIDADPRVPPIPQVPPTHLSLLALPLRGHAGIVGVLELYRPQGETFSKEELEIAMLYADLGAAAVENAQLFTELTAAARDGQARADRLEKAFEITQSFFLIRELSPLLQRIVEVVVASFGFRRASILLYDPAKKVFCSAAASDAAGAARIPPRFAEGIPEELVLRDLVDPHQVAANAYFVPGEATRIPRDQWFYRLGPEALGQPRSGPGWWHEQDRLAFKLIDRQGSLIGILSPDDPTDRRVPSKETVEALGLFANLASIAIENARLSQVEAARLAEATVRGERLRRMLNLSSLLLTSGDSEAILHQVMEAVTTLFGFQAVAIVLRTPDGQAFRTAATLGIPKEARRRMQDVRIPPSIVAAEMNERHRISRQAFYVPAEEATRETVEYFFIDVGKLERWRGPPPRERGRWSDYDALILPIRDRHGELLGVIYPEYPVDGQIPTAESVATLEIFASFAALALDLAIERAQGGLPPPLGPLADLSASHP